MRAGYVPPSQCDRCIPAETRLADLMHLTISELAHESACPNHPTNWKTS